MLGDVACSHGEVVSRPEIARIRDAIGGIFAAQEAFGQAFRLPG
jgi:hypothetical protein